MKLREDLIEIKKWVLLILIAIFSYLTLNNFSVVIEFLGTFLSVIFPFILGGIIAYILNIPTKKIEAILEKYIDDKESKGFVRIISIIVSLFIFIVVFIFIAFLLIPELIESIGLLMTHIPDVILNGQKFVIDLLDKYPDIQIKMQEIFTETGNISEVVSNVLNYFVNGAIGFISSLVSSFVTFFTAIVFSIYMLSQKEYLIRCFDKVINAFMSKKHVEKVNNVLSLANKTFTKFISGQCLEAVILGVIIFLVSVIFRFPYALIIAVLTSITALIPIFGALIAMVVGAVLIGITNPIQAILFIAIFLIVQQIEGNFIYPKVVGKSVGLSPLWTLLAITVGGNLFGIVGMLIGLPLASIIYALIKENVNNKLKSKKIIIK